VDGYDYDVLDSANEIIRMHQPLLFVGCYHDHPHQIVGYLRTMREFSEMGYSFAIFDNFGNPLVRKGVKSGS
jgi:hypothetical protein